MSSDTVSDSFLPSSPPDSSPSAPTTVPRNWSRPEWLSAFREARKGLKDDLEKEVYRTLRNINKRLSACGGTINLLVCPDCRSPQPACGDLVSLPGSRCEVPGCQLCTTDERARRMAGMMSAMPAVPLRAAKLMKTLKKTFDRESKRQQKAAIKARRRGRSYKPSSRRQAEREETLRVLTTLSESQWYACEFVRPCALEREPRRVVASMARAATKLSKFAHALRREQAPGTSGEFTAFGSWIEPPAQGEVTLRCIFFGPAISRDRLQELAQQHVPRCRLTWLHPVIAEQNRAWATRLAGLPLGSETGEDPAEVLLRGAGAPALDPRTAALWALAATDVQCERSDGLLRDHYIPTSDGLASERSPTATCAFCNAETVFVDTQVDTKTYLARGRWYDHKALAPRVAPSRPKRSRKVELDIDAPTRQP